MAIWRRTRGGAPYIEGPEAKRPESPGLRDAMSGALRGVDDAEFRAATRLLIKSTTFAAMARRLNRAYVAVETADAHRRDWRTAWGQDEDGVLQGGPFRGRRVLAFTFLNGNLFIRAGSFELVGRGCPTCDHISISRSLGARPTDHARRQVQARFVNSVAHEVTHAFHRVTAAPAAEGSWGTFTRRFIAEEVQTRVNVRRVIDEIRARLDKGDAMQPILEAEKQDIEVATARVERDFFPGEARMTYLEAAVVNRLLDKSLRQAGLSGERVRKAKELVARLEMLQAPATLLAQAHPETGTRNPDTGLNTVFLPNQFSEVLLMRRLVHEDWKHGGGEKTVQAHAAALFPNGVRYTALQENERGGRR